MRNYSIFLRSFILLALCCTHFCCIAQDTVLRPGTDTALINRLNEFANTVPDPDSGIQLLKRPMQLSIEGNYYDGIIISLMRTARNYFLKNDYEQSIFYFKKAASYSRKSSTKAAFLHTIGDMYDREGDYVHASENYYASLNEIQNCKVMEKKVISVYLQLYNSLFVFHEELKEDSAALSYLNQAESLARKYKEELALTFILTNKSAYYQTIPHRKMDSALLLLRESESICKANNFNERESEIDMGFGSYYLAGGENEKAIAYYRSAIVLSDYPLNPSRNKTLVNASYYICVALYNMKRYKEAEHIVVPALKKALLLHINEGLTEGYQTIIDIYRASGQYKNAIVCMDSLIALKDSLTGLEKTTAINKIEIRYKTAEKDKQLSVNQLQLSQSQLMIAQQKNKIARKNILVISVGGTMLLLLLAAVAIYLQARNKQKSLEKENKISILKASVAGGDDERTRIARELHDGIGGMLSAAMMRFSSIHHENPGITEVAAYTDAMGILREMGDEIRKTAHNLMPEVLLKQSLPEAVRVFCNNAQAEGALKIDFQSYGSFENLTQGYKLNIYRIIQELIKNAMIHSGATRILVQFLQNEKKMIVSVEDNGTGFNVGEARGGLGLHNVRTRVQSLDGHITLESEPGKGTTAIIEFELPENKPGDDLNNKSA
jgi:signal transduction histidine kinase